jgi:hypothetical protein
VLSPRAEAYEEFTAGRDGGHGRRLSAYSAEEDVVLPCRWAPG